jgi:hypothetical protein
MSVVDESHGGGLSPQGLSSHDKKIMTNIKSYYHHSIKLAWVLPEPNGFKTKDGVDSDEFSPYYYYHAQKFFRNISLCL